MTTHLPAKGSFERSDTNITPAWSRSILRYLACLKTAPSAVAQGLWRDTCSSLHWLMSQARYDFLKHMGKLNPRIAVRAFLETAVCGVSRNEVTTPTNALPDASDITLPSYKRNRPTETSAGDITQSRKRSVFIGLRSFSKSSLPLPIFYATSPDRLL